MKRWKDYLLDKKSDVRPFSQHLFIVFDQELNHHKGLGGDLYLRGGLVLSHVGPLFMIGLFGRRGFSLSDLKLWNASELRPEGGEITALSEWHVGKGGNISVKLYRLLKRRVQLGIETVREMHAAGLIPYP